jgi:hypothetical protein
MDPSLIPTHAPIELAKPETVAPFLMIGNTAVGNLFGVEVVTDMSLTDRLIAIPGIRITTNDSSYTAEAFGGKATVLGGVEIAGMSHISLNEIEEFQPDKVARGGGKFGIGTYFALGNLKGETAGDLVGRYESGDAVRHDSKAMGNFLVMNRRDILSINEDIRIALGEPEPRIKTSLRNAPNLTTKLQNLQFNGQPIDGVIIIEGRSRKTSEALLPEVKLEYRVPKEVFTDGYDRLSEASSAVVDKMLLDEPQLDAVATARILDLLEGGGLNEFRRQMLVGQLGKLTSLQVGVDQGYTLGEHTQMVLSIFEKQFSSDIMARDKDTAEMLRLTLLLQDVGKPIAVELHGDKSKQTDFNHDIALSFMNGMSLNDKTKLVVSELVGQDILGTYFKRSQFDITEKGLGVDKAASEITMLAAKLGYEPTELLAMLKVLYISDAGSYTKQSDYLDSDGHHLHGGGLDYLFEDNASADTLRLNRKLSTAFDKLTTAIR